jgi:uncharacterized membrane-anchored protein
MSRRARILLALLVAGQVFVLLGLISDREFTLRTGTQVVLKTVPIDPRSLLQGDYVVLDYEIGQLPPGIDYPIGATVYVALGESDEVWDARNYYTRNLSDGEFVYIRGTVDRADHLDFGIGTFFIPEGTGHIIEQSSDVTVVVSVDRNGRAVIKEVRVDGVALNDLIDLDSGAN